MIKLLANGINITPLINGRLINLRLTDERNGAVDQLDIELDNSDELLELPEPKASLTLSLPDKTGSMIEMGTFTVDSAETGSNARISITARSADITESLKVRREISYDQTTLGGIVQQIASRNSLQAVISPVMASVVVDHFDQTSESDLSVLERLGELYDAIATVKAGRIVFLPIGQSQTVSGLPLEPVLLVKNDLLDWRYRKETSPYTGVVACWNETAGAERQEVLAGSDLNPHRIRGTYRSAAQAKAAAEAKFTAYQRAQVQFECELATGNPLALPDAPLQFMGDWGNVKEEPLIITQVIHTIGSSGYTTTISAEQSV